MVIAKFKPITLGSRHNHPHQSHKPFAITHTYTFNGYMFIAVIHAPTISAMVPNHANA